MREVYESRASNVEYKKMVNGNDKWMNQREKQELDEKLKREEEAAMLKEMTAAMNRKTMQGDILGQQGEKERLKRKEYQEKMYEERAAKLAELDYRRKIDDDKMKATETLNQLKAIRPF